MVVRFVPRILCAFLVASVAAVGSTEPQGREVVQATDRDGASYLISGPDGWTVYGSVAAPRLVALPAGLLAYRFDETAEGWLVTGSIAVGASTELVVAVGGSGGVEVLPPPQERFGRERANPVAFLEDGFLRGLAWIEGDRQEELVVMAAEWLGDRWGPVEVVSPQGPGAQMALSGAVLADGDWLVVWSGYDGEDDEIFWGRRGTDGWAAPRRLNEDNAVPDITPTVIATRSGALAAWSVYDGEDYRLRLARLEEGRWSQDAVSGARGSLFPQALRTTEGIFVLHSTVVPEGWVIVEFDEDGVLLRRLYSDVASAQRPVVLPRIGDTPQLTWPAGADGLRRQSGRLIPMAKERR